MLKKRDYGRRAIDIANGRTYDMGYQQGLDDMQTRYQCLIFGVFGFILVGLALSVGIIYVIPDSVRNSTDDYKISFTTLTAAGAFVTLGISNHDILENWIGEVLASMIWNMFLGGAMLIFASIYGVGNAFSTIIAPILGASGVMALQTMISEFKKEKGYATRES